MKRLIALAAAALLSWMPAHADRAPCFNPIASIDWNFFADEFEMHFRICSCETPGNALATRAGFTASFFEPIAVIESSAQPWNFPCLDMDFGRNFWDKYGTTRSTPQQKSFRYGHFIIYPIFSVLNVVNDFLCFERAGILNFAFLGEVMPAFNNDIYATYLNPDKLLFNTPVAQIACINDCLAATANKPINSMYWCTGCWQPSSTNTGYVAGQQPIIDAASVAVRVLDSMHQYYALTKTSNATFTSGVPGGILKNTMCKEAFFPRIIKTQYALQLAYPSTWDAVKIGEHRHWANFKNDVPSKDDVVFWVWRKRDECAGAYECKSTFTGL